MYIDNLLAAVWTQVLLTQRCLCYLCNMNEEQSRLFAVDIWSLPKFVGVAFIRVTLDSVKWKIDIRETEN